MKYVLLCLVTLLCIFLCYCGMGGVGVFSQEALMDRIVPILRDEGLSYRKFQPILAREARPGETVETTTGDGKETVNQAGAEDYVVKNQTKAGEMYIVEKEEFEKRYEFQKEAADGFSEYRPKGTIVALEMTPAMLNRLGLETTFYFMASWDEKMVVKKDDFLVSPPDFSEVYRIARKEFFETYRAID